MSFFNDQMARYKQARKLLQPFLDLSLKRTVINAQKIPQKGGMIVIGNHRSDMDPFVLGSVIGRYIAWMAAGYDFKIPIFGEFLKELGMIPISENRAEQIKAFKTVSKVIKSERMVGIFPEGDKYITNNDFSRRLGDFNAGFAHYALKLKVDILPTTIIGVKEQIQPWPVPKMLREFLGMPKHVIDTKNRLSFKEVKVVIGDVIKIKEYQSLEKKEAIEKIIHNAKSQMHNAIIEYGEIERRSSKERRSGTRVFPSERP